MNLIRKYFTQIKTQLAALTISQKLLIGLLGLFMVGTIFWTVVWSAKPQMVPLIEQSMSPEEINRVDMALKGKYEYQISSDKIMVPVEQAYAIRGELASQGLLPKDISRAFDAAIKNQSLFSTEGDNVRIWNNAKEAELIRYLDGFPYIDDANVIISLGQQATLGRAPVPSTASVGIKTKGGSELNSGQVKAIADLVASSVSGLNREDVHIIANGQHSYHVPSSDTELSSNLVEFKKTYEDYLQTKLEDLCSNYGDAKIAVNVDPDLSSQTVNETGFDPKSSVSKPIQESNQDSSSSDGAGPGGQPGIMSNVGTAVADTAPAAGRGSGSTSSVTHTTNAVAIGQTSRSSIIPAGTTIKALTVSISLPRSYFVSVYRRQKGDDKAEPKDDDLASIIDKQTKSVHDLAKNAISAKTDDQIRVDWYDDSILMKMPGAAAATTTFASGTMPMITQYAKQGFLVLIACGALFMMLRMVRRAVPGGADESDAGLLFAGAGGAGAFGGGGRKGKKKGGVEQLDAQDDVFGEANQGEAVLTGIELDDETLASRKMVDEVSIMIKENPENAAALVKRWMTKNK